MINNPFVIYGYKGAEYFCDRIAETAKIKSALHGERNVTLVAPRRMGKTGLIRHAFNQLGEEDSDTRCFYVDIYSTRNLEQMVQLLASEIIGRLDTLTQAAIRRIQEFFSSWRPVINFDQLTGMPSVTLDLKPSDGAASLKRIFEYMQQSGRRCYVAIDEFQQILNYPETGVEALIRSYVQFLPNVYFIFSGSHQHMMEEMFLSSGRPFYQSSMIMSLTSIAEDVYGEFANSMFKRQHRTMNSDTFHHVYDVAGGVTWYVQAILHNLYDKPNDLLTIQSVDFAVRELIDEQSDAYMNYCSWLTDNQYRLLYAIAHEGSIVSPLAQDFILKYHLPATSSIKTALKGLMEKNLVSRTPKGYYVSDRLFAIWLATTPSPLC